MTVACLTLREAAGYLRLRLRAQHYIIIVLAAVVVACARRLPELEPIERPGEVAQRLRTSTIPDRPRHIVFEWRYRGREGRYAGDGGVRFNPPDSVRLDLLGPGWSGVQSAVLLGDDVYYLGEQRITLPPPTFMWTMMGAFRPPAGVEPEAGRRGERLELAYPLGGERVVTFVFDELDRLVEARLVDDGSVIEEIRLEPGGSGEAGPAFAVPRQARYRDLRNFHEVSIEVSEVREREAFDSAIFRVVAR